MLALVGQGRHHFPPGMGEGVLSTRPASLLLPEGNQEPSPWLCTPPPAYHGKASPCRGPVPLPVWCPTDSRLSPQGSHPPLPTGQGDPRARWRQGQGTPHISGYPGKELGHSDPTPTPSRAGPLTASLSGEMVTDPCRPHQHRTSAGEPHQGEPRTGGKGARPRTGGSAGWGLSTSALCFVWGS